jgi:hypothetical protein
MNTTSSNASKENESLSSPKIQDIEQLYRSKIEAIELHSKTINQILEWMKIGGGALTIGIAILGWWFGNSYSTATENAQKAASSAFEREFFKNTENAKDFTALKTKYDTAIQSLKKIETDLKGYSELRNIIGNVENFDPLELYASLDKEIDQRYERSKLYSDPEAQVKINETVFDPAFRQRASYVFDRLLKAVKEDTKNGRPKVEIITLFNAAANASKMDMDFVSLELMEAAARQDKSNSPENSARLIRQRLTMSRISSEEGIQAIQLAIMQTNGFNMDQVLAEAFNIGIKTAQPARVAKIINEKLQKNLQSTSYAKLISARLYLMGSTESDWKEGERLFHQGVELMQREPNTVRWKGDSLIEIKRLMKEINN